MSSVLWVKRGRFSGKATIVQKTGLHRKRFVIYSYPWSVTVKSNRQCVNFFDKKQQEWADNHVATHEFWKVKRHATDDEHKRGVRFS